MSVDGLRADQEGTILHVGSGSGIERVDGEALAQAAGGVTAGFTAGTGTTVVSGSSFTGNTGSTAYTIGDVVAALKNLGLIEP